MRHLKITKTFAPDQQDAIDQAMQMLQSLPVPAECPPHLYARYLVPNFRFILSLAAHYQGHGLSMAELALAGYAAAVACIIHFAGQPERLADLWTWWVRQGILAAVTK